MGGEGNLHAGSHAAAVVGISCTTASILQLQASRMASAASQRAPAMA